MTDKYYESRFKFNPTRGLVWSSIVKFHQKFIPDYAVAVDLGAGYCDFINLIKASKKYAVDISPETPKYKNSEVEFIQTGATNLSKIPPNSVDVLHASNLLEHFNDEDLEIIIKEVSRVLKIGGKLILMQPNYKLSYKYYFDDYTHKKVWSEVSLGDFLVAHDFKILLNMPKFLPFSMKSDSSLLPRFLIPSVVSAYIHSPIKPFAGQMLLVAQKI